MKNYSYSFHQIKELISLLILSITLLLLLSFKGGATPAISLQYLLNQISVSFITIPKMLIENSPSMVAFTTWLTAFPKAELIILGEFNTSYPYSKVLMQKYPNCVILTYPVQLGEDNRPLVREWFLTGIEKSSNSILIFINGDIILLPSFKVKLDSMLKVLDQQSPPINNFLLLTDRRKTKIIKPFDDKTDVNTINQYLTFTNQRLMMGCDIFIFRKEYPPFNFSEMPNFLVGLPLWDSYFLGRSLNNTNVIRFDKYEPIYHIPHERTWNKRKNRDPRIKQLSKMMEKLMIKSKVPWGFIKSAPFNFNSNGVFERKKDNIVISL